MRLYDRFRRRIADLLGLTKLAARVAALDAAVADRIAALDAAVADRIRALEAEHALRLSALEAALDAARARAAAAETALERLNAEVTGARSIADQGLARAIHVDEQVTRLDRTLSEIDARLGSAETASAKLGAETTRLESEIIRVAAEAANAARLTAVEEASAKLGAELTRFEQRIESQERISLAVTDGIKSVRHLAEHSRALAEHVDQQVTRIDNRLAQSTLEVRQARLQVLAADGGPATSGEATVAMFAPSGVPPLLLPTSPQPPDLIFICSHGRTATRWLTRVLNQHPEIVAGHGPSSPPELVGRPGATPTVQGNDPILDPEALQKRPITELRQELLAYEQGRYPVRVHTLSAFHVMQKLSDEMPKLGVRVVNIVRHPLTRVDSYRRHWLTPLRRARFEVALKDSWEHDPLVRHYAQSVTRKNPQVDLGELENAYFVMAVRWIAHDFIDFTLPIDHFGCEALTSDIGALRHFMERTFGPDVTTPPALIAAHGSTPRENTTRELAASPRETFAEWFDWQRALFSKFCHDADLPRLYARFGYDFSFLDGTET